MSERVQSFYVERDGVRLHAVDEGPRDAPLVVMVHGYPDDLTVWDGVAALLRDRFRIVRYDVRGAGLSDTPKSLADYALSELKADLFAVVDTVAPDAAFHIVGHDWGSIQLWEAVMDSVQSARIQSFVSASGPALDYIAVQSREALRSGDPAQLVGALKQAARSWYVGAFQLPVLPALAWTKRTTRWTERQIARAEGLPISVFQDAQRGRNGRAGVALYRANIIPRMRKPQPRPSRVPVCVLVVEGDAYVTPMLARSCEPWLTEVEFVPVEGRHWFYLSEPALFADEIARFVTKHS